MYYRVGSIQRENADEYTANRARSFLSLLPAVVDSTLKFHCTVLCTSKLGLGLGKLVQGSLRLLNPLALILAGIWFDRLQVQVHVQDRNFEFQSQPQQPTANSTFALE
jgi:hypothetical protein